jgi:hypothetical protein
MIEVTGRRFTHVGKSQYGDRVYRVDVRVSQFGNNGHFEAWSPDVMRIAEREGRLWIETNKAIGLGELLATVGAFKDTVLQEDTT